MKPRGREKRKTGQALSGSRLRVCAPRADAHHARKTEHLWATAEHAMHRKGTSYKGLGCAPRMQAPGPGKEQYKQYNGGEYKCLGFRVCTTNATPGPGERDNSRALSGGRLRVCAPRMKTPGACTSVSPWAARPTREYASREAQYTFHVPALEDRLLSQRTKLLAPGPGAHLGQHVRPGVRERGAQVLVR